MEQINFLNVANITPSTFDNLATLVTQQMASNVSLGGQFPQSPINTIDLRIQIKDMEIKMNQMEMKVDGLEGKIDEKLIQERLDHQTEMLAWKAQAKKEKDDLEVEIPKLQDKIHDIEQRLKNNFVYSL
ncbi:hypothetical protein ACHAPG_001852 [Botrytis cinerea]